MIPLEWFRTFIAVYQHGTTTAASEVLFMTQPGVSNHITGLESAIGIKLFNRTARRMLPTEKGKELYSWLIEPMERLDIIENRLKTLNAPAMSDVRIGSPAEYFHISALQRIDRPSLRYNIRFELTDVLLKLLEQGELDIVISTRKTEKKEWHCDFLMEENFILVAPKESQVFNTEISPEEVESRLLGQRWVVFGRDLPVMRRYWKVNFGKRPFIDPVLTIPNYLSIIKAVSLGLGMSIVPEYLCGDELKNKEIILPWRRQEKVTNNLYLVYRKGFRGVSAVADVVAALKSIEC